jgi:hypothetical protein
VKFIVASYPRSGNHLVRGILEFGFRRPTLGLPAFLLRDGPIANRPPNAAKRVIAIDDREPIGLKAHWLHHVLAHEQQFPDATGVLLVTRNPADAITSQLLRRFSRVPWLTERRLRLGVERNVSDYLGLLYLHQAWRADRRWHLEFDRLVDPAGSLDYVNAFLADVGAPHRLDATQWAGLQQVTKESQTSLGSLGASRKPRVRAAVEAYLKASDAERILAGRRREPCVGGTPVQSH